MISGLIVNEFDIQLRRVNSILNFIDWEIYLLIVDSYKSRLWYLWQNSFSS